MSEEPRRVLIYWDRDVRVKALMGRDERGVAQLETFGLREGEFGPGVEFIEAAPIVQQLPEREQMLDLLERWNDCRSVTVGTQLHIDTKALLEQAGRTQPKEARQ